MAIFTSMVLLATMALNQGLKQYQGLMEKGINFWDNAKGLWINRSIGSAFDYYVQKDNRRWFPYFYGSQDRISYVSLSPVAGDTPVVAWIVKERQDNGKYSMVYYELPVYTKTFAGIDRAYALGEFKKGQSVKFLEDIEELEVRYYGHDFSRKRDDWFRDFDGMEKMVLPSLITLGYTVNGKKNTRTFAINTNSLRKIIYNEIY